MTKWIEATLAAVDESRNALTNAQDAIAATPSGLPLGEMKEARDRLREHHIMELRAALLNQQLRKTDEKLEHLLAPPPSAPPEAAGEPSSSSSSSSKVAIGRDLTRVWQKKARRGSESTGARCFIAVLPRSSANDVGAG